MNEKTLDTAFENGLRNSPEFVKWLLSHTKFCGSHARYDWSRSDHPWGRVLLRVENPMTGITESVTRESETDILVVFEEMDTAKRFALHVENKMAGGSFTKYQPESYRVRAEKWLDDSKYGSYSDFETMLIAPTSFTARFPSACRIFDRFVSHEDIGRFIPEFGVVTNFDRSESFAAATSAPTP